MESLLVFGVLIVIELFLIFWNWYDKSFLVKLRIKRGTCCLVMNCHVTVLLECCSLLNYVSIIQGSFDCHR